MIRLRLLPFLLFLGSGRPASLGPNNVPSSLAEDCTADSLALKNMTTYQIQIVYTDSPTDDNSVVFQLYNPVIGVDAQCAAYGPGLGVGDTRNDTWYGCFIESRDTRISASFAYDFVLNQVTVNETWVCDSANSSTLFQAFGPAKLPAPCRNATDQGVFQFQCLEDEEKPLPVTVTSKEL